MDESLPVCSPAIDANLVYVDGRWLVTSPAENTEMELMEMSGEVGSRLGRLPAVREEDISALTAMGFLRTLPTPAEALDLETWRYLAMREADHHSDYSAPGAIAADEERVRGLARSEPPPPLSPALQEADLLRLPHPLLCRREDPLARVAAVLFFAFGWKRKARYFETFEVALTLAPSNGARHPLEGHLRWPGGGGLDRGEYRYFPEYHGLVAEPFVAESTAEDPMILVSTVWEREQWRYRHSASYRDVFFDAGHLLSNLRAVAARRGFTTAVEEVREPRPLAESLREEPLYRVTLRGERE